MFPRTLLAFLLVLAAGPGAQTTPPATRIQLFLIERPRQSIEQVLQEPLDRGQRRLEFVRDMRKELRS